MSLNCPTIYVNDNISYIGIFQTLFNSHCYVCFDHDHQLDFVRVSKELNHKQFSFEATPLLSHISDFLIQSNLFTLLRISDA